MPANVHVQGTDQRLKKVLQKPAVTPSKEILPHNNDGFQDVSLDGEHEERDVVCALPSIINHEGA